jgi:hypothetical protein
MRAAGIAHAEKCDAKACREGGAELDGNGGISLIKEEHPSYYGIVITY